MASSQDAVSRLNAALADCSRIQGEIGEGGMATVYLAQDLKHGRAVALKVLKPERAALMGAERFLSEIKTTANLQHPHILPLFDSGEADGFLFYVMPFVEGESLRDRINRERQLPVDRFHSAEAFRTALADEGFRHTPATGVQAATAAGHPAAIGASIPFPAQVGRFFRAGKRSQHRIAVS